MKKLTITVLTLTSVFLYNCNNEKPVEKSTEPTIEIPEEIKAIKSNLQATQNSATLEALLKELMATVEKKEAELKRELTQTEIEEVRASINFEERSKKIQAITDSINNSKN